MNTTLSFPIKGQTILNQAKDLVPGFAAAFQKFQQHIVLQQNSPSSVSYTHLTLPTSDLV